MAAALAIGAALSGLSALAGLFPKKQVSTTNSTVSSNPNYDPQSAQFKDFLMSMFKGRIDNNEEFESGYKSSGLNNILDTTKRSSDSLGDILTSRGLSRTGAGASAAVDNSYRGAKDISSFLNSLPMLFDERRRDNLNAGAGFFSSLPVGTTTTTNSRTEGSAPTSPLGGAIIGGSSGLASYLGQISANNQLKNILKTIGTPKPGVGTGGSIPDGTGDKSYGISW